MSSATESLDFPGALTDDFVFPLGPTATVLLELFRLL